MVDMGTIDMTAVLMIEINLAEEDETTDTLKGGFIHGHNPDISITILHNTALGCINRQQTRRAIVSCPDSGWVSHNNWQFFMLLQGISCS